MAADDSGQRVPVESDSPTAPRREWVVLLLLLVAATWIRVPGLARPFDREFAGHQNSFFAIAAVNYARDGVGRHAGYPSARIAGPAIVTDDVVPAEGDDAASVYVNHPPTVPLLAYASVRAFAPDGWDARWRDGLAPEGLEAPLRAPFLALHVLGLLAIAWAARPSLGGRGALLAVTIAAVVPVGLAYGSLVNYENAALPFVVTALGAWIRHARDGSRRMLVLAAASILAASTFTWAPLAYAAAIPLVEALRGRLRLALRAACVLGPAAVLPLAGHVLLAGASGAQHDGVLTRASVLLAPIAESPARILEWSLTSARAATDSIGLVALALAGVSIGIGVVAGRTRSEDATEPDRGVGPAADFLPLLVGAVLYLLAFHRHTLEPQRMFQLALVPGVALLSAHAIEAVRGRGPSRRTALAALLVLAIGAESIPRWSAILDSMHAPAPTDFVAAALVPLPHDAAREIASATPPEALVLVPRSTGLHLATGYYAWRNVVLVDSPRVLDSIRAAHPSTRAMPVFALVPERLDGGVTESAARFELDLPAGTERADAPSGWRSWRLP